MRALVCRVHVARSEPGGKPQPRKTTQAVRFTWTTSAFDMSTMLHLDDFSFPSIEARIVSITPSNKKTKLPVWVTVLSSPASPSRVSTLQRSHEVHHNIDLEIVASLVQRVVVWTMLFRLFFFFIVCDAIGIKSSFSSYI